QQAVATARFSSRLQSDGRVVQELVEQCLAELFHTGPILGAEVAQLSERPLELMGAQVIHPLPELLDGRNDAEAAVPGPKEIRFFVDDSLGGGDLVATPGGRVRGDCLQIIHVVQEHELELSYCSVDVGRPSQNENTDQLYPPVDTPNHRTHPAAFDHG